MRTIEMSTLWMHFVRQFVMWVSYVLLCVVTDNVLLAVKLGSVVYVGHVSG